MQKIMFSDKFHLTKAVLEGRKTMTRRIIPGKYQDLCRWDHPVLVVPLECIPEDMTIEEFAKMWAEHTGEIKAAPVMEDMKIGFLDMQKELIERVAKYKIGEVVAVAQNYKDAGFDGEAIADSWAAKSEFPETWNTLPGFTNKMFVQSEFMPHKIRVTNVRVERLQDISDEDVYKEGFSKESVNNGWGNYAWHWEAMLVYYDDLGMTKEIRSPDPREAFAALIDRVSGKGTWDSNPWVFVYEFELVK